jgi:hypothetical protein
MRRKEKNNPGRVTSLDRFGVWLALLQADFQSICVTDIAVLAGSHPLDTPLIHQILQTDIIEELEYLVAELVPQFVSQALLAIMAIDCTTAARGVDSLVYRGDDFGNGNPAGRSRQGISPARSTGAGNKSVLAQASEQLFQVGQ